MRQKNLGKLPVLDYRKKNGKAVIEAQLRVFPSAPPKPLYDPEKLIVIFQVQRFLLANENGIL
jgi:hypothetical protein